MKKPILTTFLLLVLCTIFFGTIYVVSQQVLRMNANDPQIQMAEDIARGLASGSVPASFMPADRSQVDISQSLAPFVMIFDAQGKVLESSARFGNSLLVPPKGVLDATQYGENRITWQPQDGLREAIVVLSYYAGQSGGTFEHDGGGFVLVGRSLREVEVREANTFKLVVFGWAVSVLLILGFSFWYNRKKYETQ